MGDHNRVASPVRRQHVRWRRATFHHVTGVNGHRRRCAFRHDRAICWRDRPPVSPAPGAVCARRAHCRRSASGVGDRRAHSELLPGAPSGNDAVRSGRAGVAGAVCGGNGRRYGAEPAPICTGRRQCSHRARGGERRHALAHARRHRGDASAARMVGGRTARRTPPTGEGQRCLPLHTGYPSPRRPSRQRRRPWRRRPTGDK